MVMIRGAKAFRFFRGVCKRLEHLAEDMQPPVLRLLKGRAHDIDRDAFDLHVHLERGDPLARSGDLEIHVPEVVFKPEDIGEHDHLVAFLDETHGDARDRGLDGHACVHERQRTAANRGHGRRTIGLKDVRYDPDGIRELLLGRHHCLQRALCERPVADFAPARSPQGLGLAHAERREIIVEHECLEVLSLEGIDALLVHGRSEGGNDQCLGLAAGKEGRAVCPGEHADNGTDRPDLVRLSSVGAQYFFPG